MNIAQQIHQALGVAVNVEIKQAHGAKSATSTKAGPGRYHVDGHSTAQPRKLSLGAGSAFVMHAASPAKKSRRALVKAVGRRQARKLTRVERELSSDWLAIPDVEAPVEA